MSYYDEKRYYYSNSNGSSRQSESHSLVPYSDVTSPYKLSNSVYRSERVVTIYDGQVNLAYKPNVNTTQNYNRYVPDNYDKARSYASDTLDGNRLRYYNNERRIDNEHSGYHGARRNSNVNRQYNNRSYGIRKRPYDQRYFNKLKARKIAELLKNVNNIDAAMDALCFLMEGKKDQPLYAVLQELMSIERENQIKNSKNYSDKATQTFKTMRPRLKREYCTPIAESSLENSYGTPQFNNKVSVKIEKITPLRK